jgi:hypothetical protein
MRRPWCFFVVHVLAIVTVFALAVPAQAADADTRVHFALPASAQRAEPRKVLVLPPEVTVYELSAGGVTQKVPERTRVANENLERALAEVLAARTDIARLPMPALTPEQQDEVDDFVATFNVVAGDAFRYTRSGLAGWEDRAARFDYTLGEGLPWLRAQVGADALLVVYGVDYQSTGGRKAMAVLGVFAGVVVPTGHAALRSGMIDLVTGEILWLHHEGTATSSLTDAEAMRRMVRETLDALPALAAPR